MDRFILPQGDAAALMPGVSYSIPGLFLYSSLVYRCLDQVEAKFGYRIPVKYLYGSPQVRWNCGRLLFKDHGETMDDVAAELSGAAARGITPLLTFSATSVSHEDLLDPKGNDSLRLLDQVHGGAIVSDVRLQRYIQDHYPNVETHASVILTSFAEKRDAAYYGDLSRRFHRYVLHPDDNFDLALLAQVPKANAEIILNERCGYRCPQRREHYLSITEDQAKILDKSGSLSNFLDRCPYTPDWKQGTMKERGISLTIEETAALSKMGFNLFKLQGRLDIPYVFFFDFLRYALEPEAAFPSMFPIFSYSIMEYEKEKRSRTRK